MERKHKIIFLEDSKGIVKLNLDKIGNLFVLSDDEIKKGDWYIFKNKVFRSDDNSIDNDHCKKIIATTDTSLRIPRENSHPNSIWKLDGALLPQPSQSFIEKYVEEYNKGNIITEVLVELLSEESYGADLAYFGLTEPEVKVNPKDNTITIRKVKDSWSREELIPLFKEVYIHGGKSARDFKYDFDIEKWIKENL